MTANLITYPDLLALQSELEGLEIDIPAPLTKALHLFDVADDFSREPTGAVLGMTDADAEQRILDLSLRRYAGTSPGSKGLFIGERDFKKQVIKEFRDAMLPLLDGIVASLRDSFDELAQPFVTAAQTYGFSDATTSDDVVLMRDADAIEAWLAARDAWHSLNEITSLRELLSEMFGVSPTNEEQRFGIVSRSQRAGMAVTPVDYSVCYAAAGNWSTDGAYYVDRNTENSIDWLAMATAGLRLNTPSEVAAKQQQRHTAGIPA